MYAATAVFGVDSRESARRAIENTAKEMRQDLCMVNGVASAFDKYSQVEATSSADMDPAYHNSTQCKTSIRRYEY